MDKGFTNMEKYRFNFFGNTNTSTKNICAVLSVFFMSISSMILFVPQVSASPDKEPARAYTTASNCLDNGPSAAIVGQVTVGGVFGRQIVLNCGDYTHGIIHIDSSHPISEDGSDDDAIVQCMSNILTMGYEYPANQGNIAYRIERPGGGTATIVYREDTVNDYFENYHVVVSMYTSDSNNWAACARYPN
ncbi:hypothetical protein [Actinopolyspora erythraea]|uniref:hypothetical protein n=1 Tax=Actinopolyspora erythraea TaxID=414996 RepID=UPI0011851C05|nr:hypothetical protein [Actinopolyspora erythraea]